MRPIACPPARLLADPQVAAATQAENPLELGTAFLFAILFLIAFWRCTP